MFRKTFKGGVSLAESKELTVDKKIKSVPPPGEVILPLSQHMGAPNKPIVNVGDHVKAGQRIGEAEAFISACLHSSISGTVKSISDFPNPIFNGKGPAIRIENDGKGEFLPLPERKHPGDLSGKEVADIARDAGLVGLGGAASPTHVKLNVPKGKRIECLIINGAECEPYLTCDHRLMVEKPAKILRGMYLIAGILSVKNIVLAIEDNKLSAIFAMEKVVHRMNKKVPNRHVQIAVLKTKYPQGDERQLIKAILRREVPPGKLPMDVGAVVHNVGTCFAIYEAVYDRKPLIERCITFTGRCLKEPGNYIVPIGTPLRYMVDYCGGFRKPPAKIIAGGPMMGIAQYSLDAPIVKGLTGVLFLSREEAQTPEEFPCIRCARCVDICPVNLLPTEIMRMVKYSRWHYMDRLNPVDCMECGACAYVCPSKTPLVQYIKLAKLKGKDTTGGSL
jgi:electron transport complex protein RnfC